MSSSVIAFFIGAVIFFIAFCMYAGITIIMRLTNIELNTEKTALLLTVIATKQGATSEDVEKAFHPDTEAPKGAASSSKGGKKK